MDCGMPEEFKLKLIIILIRQVALMTGKTPMEYNYFWEIVLCLLVRIFFTQTQGLNIGQKQNTLSYSSATLTFSFLSEGEKSQQRCSMTS